MIYVKTLTDAYRLINEITSLLRSEDFDSYVTDLNIEITVTDDEGNSGVYKTELELDGPVLDIELDLKKRLLRGDNNK